MDPVMLTLGAVGVLIAKAVDKMGDKATDAGWAAVGRLVGKIRQRFREHSDDAEGGKVLN